MARDKLGRRGLAAGLWIGIAALAVAPPAFADTVSGTRSDKLVEKSHRVELRFDRGHAELVVRRTVHNGGARVDQAVFFLDLPGGAVATGLRTLGIVDDKPHWFVGELMEAEAAAEKYRELTGIGGAYPKDPALLSWRDASLLELQVFPVPVGQPKTIEYTLRIPTTYEDGRDRLDLPRLGTESLAADVVVRAARPGDRIFLDGKPVADGSLLSFGKDDDALALTLGRAAPPPIDGALVSVRIGMQRQLVRWRLEAREKLSTIPRRAHVVVVLDGSRSVSDEDGEAAVAAARAYLGHFRDARVEVLTFDRDVHARHGEFVPVSRAITQLDAKTIGRRNGSALEQALARADALLAALPAGTPLRIVALTDLRTRARLDVSRLRAVQKSGAVLHVGQVGSGEPSLERDDDEPWAKSARATGGLFWRAGATDAVSDAKKMSDVYEEWARPVRIDLVKLSAAGLEADAISAPAVLEEGQAIVDLRLESKHVPSVKISGELWSTPIEKSLAPDEAEAERWAAMVFGSELLHQLSDEEMMVLARRGHAVSPVTSFLAIEPGVRPSTEGLEPEGLGLTGIGQGGGGVGFGIGTSGHGSMSRFDHAAFLRNALRPGLRACGAKDGTATLDIETTLDEIVDLVSVTIEGEGAGSKLVECVTHAAWDITLSSDFAAESATFSVEL